MIIEVVKISARKKHLKINIQQQMQKDYLRRM